jgi:hypothetical protein
MNEITANAAIAIRSAESSAIVGASFASTALSQP